MIIRLFDHAVDYHAQTGTVLVCPSLLGHDTTSIFQEAGFHRIGISAWFGKPVDAAHPVRKATKDIEPPATNPSELEALEQALDLQRTRVIGIEVSDNFHGFSDDDVKRLLDLRGILFPTDLQVLQAKYGCTCGKCVGGFISSRMSFILISCANKIRSDFDILVQRGCTRFGWMAEVFRVIADLLQRDQIPTKTRALEALQAANPIAFDHVQRGESVIFLNGASHSIV